MKKTLLICLAATTLCLWTMPEAAAAVKKPKATEEAKADTTKSASAGSKYDRLFKGKTYQSAKSPFITLHKFEGGKVYIEIPMSYLGREMVLASTISEVSNPNYASIGYKPKDPIHFAFEMGDSTILMKNVEVDFTYDKSNANYAKAMKLNSLSPIINSFKIAAHTNDHKGVVFEVTSLFNTNNALIAPMGASNNGLMTVTASFVSSGSYVNEVKAFEDNAVIKSTLSYTLSASMLGMSMGKDIPFTLVATRTILLLSEEKMRPRISDSRLGIFLTDKYHLTMDQDQVRRYSIAHRWRVEPSDPQAYKRGQQVEPVKPIIFYIDNTFPESWKEPIRRGALRWNAAFEQIGFKNVIQVRDFPADDPLFDPDNLKYSCIRYIPNAVSNAMGPSWVDPNTGEIINASVLIFNDVIKLINQWRFIQTA